MQTYSVWRVLLLPSVVNCLFAMPVMQCSLVDYWLLQYSTNTDKTSFFFFSPPSSWAKILIKIISFVGTDVHMLEAQKQFYINYVVYLILLSEQHFVEFPSWSNLAHYAAHENLVDIFIVHRTEVRKEAEIVR